MSGFAKVCVRSHYAERTSALDFKDAVAPRFSHSYVVFDLNTQIEVCFFFVFYRSLMQFSKTF